MEKTVEDAPWSNGKLVTEDEVVDACEQVVQKHNSADQRVDRPAMTVRNFSECRTTGQKLGIPGHQVGRRHERLVLLIHRGTDVHQEEYDGRRERV